MSEEVGDSFATEVRESDLELLDGKDDEVRVAIDGRRRSDESVLVKPLGPSGDGLGREQEPVGSALHGPTSSELEGEDTEALIGGVVRSQGRREPCEAGAEELVFPLELLELRAESSILRRRVHAAEGTVFREGSSFREGAVSEGDDGEEGSFDASGPVVRQRSELDVERAERRESLLTRGSEDAKEASKLGERSGGR